MASRSSEFKVGITLSIAGVVLILGILWLGGMKLGEERYGIGIVFEEVGGLGAGDKVTVAGLVAGEVLGLELMNGKVLADIEIDSDIRIPVDSRISVASYGLIGAKSVAIKPGVSSEHVPEGAVVRGIYDKGLGDVVSEMGEALTEIRSVLKAADAALSDVEAREQVKTTLRNASVATTDLVVAVADLKETAASLREFIEQNEGGATSTIDSFEEASERFAAASGEIETMSASLDSIVGRLEGGEGTLGKLLTDEQAHDEFLAAVREVRDLVAEIRENPKSFVKFSLF